MNTAAKVVEAPEVARRREILRSAIQVFAKKGYYGCRIADVAKQAGVAYGLVYHYFRNKEELLQSVFDESWGRFTQMLQEIGASQQPLTAQVGAIVDVAVAAYRENPDAVRVLILEIARSPVFRQADKRTAFESAIRTTAGILAAGQRRGEMRDDLDPFVAASVLFGAIEVVLTAFVMGGLDPRRESHFVMARTGVVEIFMGGVGPKARPRKPANGAHRSARRAV
jgi:TetR/AcrR family transcriptional regulator, fatty acid metabolism regulator protein